MNRNFILRVSCRNGACDKFGTVWNQYQVKEDEWLKRSRCPSCHKKIGIRPRCPKQTRYILTVNGEWKRVDMFDSLPLQLLTARQRR